ncbi:MAG TPA: hypothetical protein VGI79_20405 [Caulobacteraceae bacterium]|jgi:hypothetical protein
MNPRFVAVIALAGLTLGGCKRLSDSAAELGDHHGRYSSVGIYGPSRQWTKLAVVQQAKDPQTAQLIDDQVIIVVQNSATGEVRACGDLTGYCIGMNPWKTALVSAQIAPLKLTEHRPPDEPDATVAITAKGSDSEAAKEKDDKASSSQ